MHRVPLKRVARLRTDVGHGKPGAILTLDMVESQTGRLLTDAWPLDTVSPVSGVAAVSPGDVLFGKLRPYLAKVVHASRECYASTELLCLTPSAELDSRWFYYRMLSRSTIEWAVATSDGSKMPRTNWQRLGELTICVPSLSEQRAVARDLDSETARIDALIAKKQRMQERLLERRKSITYYAVGSSNSDVGRVKPSGIPWLPEIPDHWREVPLTLVARLGSGHTPSRERPDWWVDCNTPWITTGEVAQMRSDEIEYISDTRECLSKAGLANSSAELHPAGTVVLSRTASAGFSAIMAQDMATSQDFVTWTCGPRLDPRFLLLCLRAMRDDLLQRLAQGSTHKTIYMPDIKSIRIPLPPLDEQRIIVQQTWAHLRKVDDVVDRLRSQDRLLRAHRQALITAAVTGDCVTPGGHDGQ